MNNTRNLTVVYICPHVDGYGADRSLLNNVIYLKTIGVSPIFIIPKQGLIIEYLNKHSIPFYVLDYRTWTKGQSKNPIIIQLKTVAKLFINVVSAFKMRYELRKQKISIVHTNDLVTNFGVILSRLIKARHIIHSRCLLHESQITFDLGENYSLNIFKKHSSAFIFNSQVVFDYYKHYCEDKDCHMIHSAVFNKNDTSIPIKTSLDQTTPVQFIFIGRYEDQKDPATIIRAIKILLDKKVNGFKVSLFGKIDTYSHDYCNRMKSFIDENHLSGFVEINDFDRDISTKIKYYDVGLFTSPMEGIARVIIEFMINGLPVIGSNSGAASYLIKNNNNGLLFKPKDASDLAEKMQLLIDNKSTIYSMGQKAICSVGESFSTEYTSEKILNIYKSVLTD